MLEEFEDPRTKFSGGDVMKRVSVLVGEDVFHNFASERFGVSFD
jgi:hypothetical protein